jgi:peptide/nickel transport system ATP-binding protein
VMIAMTLAAEPDYLVADEPTTALDVTIQAQILDLLKRLQRERGMGLLLITHDLAVVSDMADQVALMYAGQIIEVAPASEFFSAPQHPYARLLLNALPDVAKRGEVLAAIGGTVPPLSQAFSACRFEPRCDRAFEHCRQQAPGLLPLPSPEGTSVERSVRCFLHDVSVAQPMSGLAAAPRTIPVHAQPRPRPSSAMLPSEGPPLLQVNGLRVVFPLRSGLLQRVGKGFTAVDGVSFSLRRGQTLALVGESGCGKTTTGKAIVQLLRRQAVIEGTALLEGQDLFALQGAALLQARSAVQMIFQDPFASLNPRMRIFDILEEGLLALKPGLGAQERRQRLSTLVDRVGLRPDALERYPHEFSGGQRQRLAIARALAVEPQLIVCDEPTSALDVSVQAQILNLLRELQTELGVSYLFITHNIGVVAYLADDIAVMNRGRIEECGPATTLLAHPQSAYTRELLAAVPRLRHLRTS